MPRMQARIMTTTEANYREAMARLQDAQRRYDANRDDRASDRAFTDAIRDVLVARADMAHLIRRHPELVELAY